MNRSLCRELNYLTLDLLAEYLGVPSKKVRSIYDELLHDKLFLREINEQLKYVRKYYKKGICRLSVIPSVDEFSIQRIVQYIIVRITRPRVVLETGVFYGGSTCFLLNALRRNKFGMLISIDLRSNSPQGSRNRHMKVKNTEDVPHPLTTGFLVPPGLKKRWNLVLGDSLKEIPKLRERIDLYNYDSDHSYSFFQREANLVWPKLNKNAIVLVDDINWSNGFFALCVKKKLYPLIITDNGKSGLLARTGIVKRGHLFELRPEVVGFKKVRRAVGKSR